MHSGLALIVSLIGVAPFILTRESKMNHGIYSWSSCDNRLHIPGHYYRSVDDTAALKRLMDSFRHFLRVNEYLVFLMTPRSSPHRALPNDPAAVLVRVICYETLTLHLVALLARLAGSNVRMAYIASRTGNPYAVMPPQQ